MWMLIRQLPAEDETESQRPPTPRLRELPRSTPKRRPAMSPHSMLAALGAVTAGATRETAGPVLVMLHPGRSPIGQASVERVFDQFECERAGAYTSLEEAEARHASDVGFLLDIRAPFTDPAGARRERGVVFARSIRN
jgi:hypothetical protein